MSDTAANIPKGNEARTDTQVLFRPKDPRASTGISRAIPAQPAPSRKPRVVVMVAALAIGFAAIVYAFIQAQKSGPDVDAQMDLQVRMDKVENQMQCLTHMLNDQNARMAKMEQMQQEELHSLQALHEQYRKNGGWERSSQPESK